MEETMQAALDVGCKRLDVFFMIGMPGQDYQSVMDTIDYCGELIRKVDGDSRLWPFISPLAPFLDPGSLAFEQSEKYGYQVRDRTLADHIRALLQPTWKHVLSYETKWMTRDEIASATYEAGLRLNRLKAESGLTPWNEALQTEERIRRAVSLLGRIDELIATTPAAELDSELMKLKPEIDVANESTVCEKEELDIPMSRMPFKPLAISKMVLEDGWAALKRRITGQGATNGRSHAAVEVEGEAPAGERDAVS
jgi:hypothetical protein